MNKNVSKSIPVILSLILILSSVALSLAWPGSTAFGQGVTFATPTPTPARMISIGGAASGTGGQPGAAVVLATNTPRPTRVVLPSYLATSSPEAKPAILSPVTFEKDLGVWLTLDSKSARVGDIVTFRLTVENEGDYRVKGLKFYLPVTDGLTILSARITRGGNTDIDRGSDVVRGSLKRLDPGQSVTLTVRTQVNRKAYDEDLSGRAKVSWSDGGYQTSNRWRLRVRNR